MKKNIVNIIVILHFTFYLFAGTNTNEIIAKIGDQIIFVNDVIERAEYTIRPLYCRGNSNLDKKIIVNTLIGEKLFSKELDNKVLPNQISNYLIGRRNQKMRDILFFDVVKNNSNNVDGYSHWYDLSGIEYDIYYLTVTDTRAIEEIKLQMDNGIDLSEIFYNLGGEVKDLPKKENITLFNIDNIALRNSLFQKRWRIGDINGPIKTTDQLTMFYEIYGVKNKVDLNPNHIETNHQEITNLVIRNELEKNYQRFVKNLMSGLSFTLDPKGYEIFVDIVNSWYKKSENVNTSGIGDNRFIEMGEHSSQQTLLILDEIPITIHEVLNWINIHPLIFREGYYKKISFNIQLKYALADLIRDRALNIEAENRGLAKHPEVLREYEKWYDNYQALKNRNNIIGNVELSSLQVPDSLNKYFCSLSKKYSDQIWINIDAIEKLDLSSIDMIAFNKTGNYKLHTPVFPIITSHHQFDFGQGIKND